MTKDEMKNRISMALKDPILQQGFEIICKENELLKSVYKHFPDLKDTMNKVESILKENAELKSIADFQTSSNMDRYFQMKRSKEQLTKAKEIIGDLLLMAKVEHLERNYESVEEAEQFLKEAQKRLTKNSRKKSL